VEIKRKLNFLSVTILVAKPSIVMGVNGDSLYQFRISLSKELSTKFKLYDITVNVVEVLNADSNSHTLAEFIRQQLEKRLPFRRIMKAAISKAQKVGVKGIKIQIAGRLNGAEIARTEWIREGQVPLHTLKANIDYCNYKARKV
jgi:small subunit ribosomal protein S3